MLAAVLRDGMAQSRALELRKVALVLCSSAGTQPPFTYCRRSRDNVWMRASSLQQFQRDQRHLQPGGEAAQSRRVQEAQAQDPHAATAQGPGVTESAVLQVRQLQRLG